MGDFKLNNEKDLLQQVATGNEASFVKLFHHYHPSIYSVAIKLLHNPVLAEELVQDVFLKIWQKRELLPEVEFFAAFLHKVAENVIYPAIRKQLTKEKNESLFKASQDSFVSSTDMFLNKEYAEILHNAVRQLPDKQKQTYILIKEEGLKRDQVAAQMKVSQETVKSNLEQAMKKIRAYCIAKIDMNIILLVACPCFL